MDIKELLQLTIDRQASDLHLIAGIPPYVRVEGQLAAVTNEEVLTPDMIIKFLKEILDPEQFERLSVNKEIDFSLAYSQKARFRVNAYTQKGSLAVSFRLIPLEIPDLEGLGLPKILHSFTGLKQGFVLVTGPTGHGLNDQ